MIKLYVITVVLIAGCACHPLNDLFSRLKISEQARSINIPVLTQELICLKDQYKDIARGTFTGSQCVDHSRWRRLHHDVAQYFVNPYISKLMEVIDDDEISLQNRIGHVEETFNTIIKYATKMIHEYDEFRKKSLV
ncbi:hypothetical protein HDE_01028 [Halotydeus destructor]|nr:hypothetical protein HDE_01028 [Halotydeus destructor]